MGSKKFDNTHMRRNFDLGQPGHVSDGTNSPPRISEAVVHAMPSDRLKDALDLGATSYENTMKQVLTRVHGRLDKGLDEAWRSTWGYDGDVVNTPDERWARLVSEMFVFSAYQGPGLAYNIKTEHIKAAGKKRYAPVAGKVADEDEVTPDALIFCRLDVTGDGKNDPAYSIVGACQHVATYMVMARGYPASALGPSGLGVGDNSDRPCFRSEWGGQWKPMTNGTMASLKAAFGADGGITPGSMFGFGGSVHIGGVLRYDPGADQFQPMDTGVLAGGTDVGTADHEARTEAVGTSSTLIGTGILSNVPPKEEWLSALPTARPLGFAHFVVADPNKKLRYVSRALPMYEGKQGFAITRYVWSLRCFPADGYGFWILSIPAKGDVSAALLAQGARYKPLRELCRGVCGTKNGEVLKPINIIVSTRGLPDQGQKDKGMAQGSSPQWLGYATGAILYRWKNDKEHNEWICYRGATQSHDDVALFTSELTSLTVFEGKSFTALWKSLDIDDEYTCKDPSAATNDPVMDLWKDVPYFGPAPATPQPAPSPPSTPSR